MHRFIHVILRMKGFRTAVIKVKHHSRVYGKTKYNMSRTFKSILDMFLLKFWMKYSARPIHLFGGVGLITSFVGFLILLYLAYVRLVQGTGIANRPALLLSILLMVIGIQFLIFGLMADILTKIYYTDKENYNIKSIEA